MRAPERSIGMDMTSKRKLAVSVALGLLAFGATRAILAGRWYRIPQNGMYPGLPAGSYLVVNRNAYRNPDDVQRGDIEVAPSRQARIHAILRNPVPTAGK